MMVIFEPDPPFVRWCSIKNGRFSRDKLIFDASRLKEIQRKILEEKKGERIVFGYVLPNGGEKIDKPINLLTGELLAKMERCIKFLPEHNGIIYKIASYLSKEFSDASHVLFCDTSFFIGLPEKTSTYAIPYKLRKKGIRRYGGYGLCHEWAWNQARQTFGKDVQRLVSVYLGSSSNIAAIKNAIPIETTIGFTSIEGIPSLNACGDIDPTIIFQLYAQGMSFERINNLLSKESGLNCLFGEAPKILQYHIVRYIGAFVSVLGGIDTIVFITENFKTDKNSILRICHFLDCLGFKSRIKINKNSSGNMILSSDSSKIKSLCLHYDKWKILSEKVFCLTDKEV